MSSRAALVSSEKEVNATSNRNVSFGVVRSERSTEMETLECMDSHKSPCSGKVEYRMNLTGTGLQTLRCDKHWEERLDFQEAHTAIYPDSPIAPDWFDPADAGERWDDDY